VTSVAGQGPLSGQVDQPELRVSPRRPGPSVARGLRLVLANLNCHWYHDHARAEAIIWSGVARRTMRTVAPGPRGLLGRAARQPASEAAASLSARTSLAVRLRVAAAGHWQCTPPFSLESLQLYRLKPTLNRDGTRPGGHGPAQMPSRLQPRARGGTGSRPCIGPMPDNANWRLSVG
jgi:hypothetical protein